MEKQTGFLGISNWAWGVVGIMALVGSIVVIALVAMLYGTDIGLGIV